MTAKKVFLFILGVISIIGGLYCAATPGLTYLSMVWVIGFVMLFHGIEDIMTYSARKAAGVADGWSLVGAVISILCGLAIVISGKAEIITGITLLYILFFWLIFTGVASIMGGSQLGKLKGSGNALGEAIADRSGWIIFIGVLMIIAGVLGFFHPLISALSIGFIVAINIMTAGINMIVRAFTI